MAEFNKFEEYKLFVEDTARFSEQRRTVSTQMLAFNAYLLTAVGLSIKDLGAEGAWTLLLPASLIAAGIFVCLWWCQLIRKYRMIVGLRLDTLRKMEDAIPESVKMYHIEDSLYPRDRRGSVILGKGLNFEDLEARLGVVFGLLYCIFGLGLLATLVL